jgi:hypothetical protein
MLASRYLFGLKKVGYTKTIREVGFNGTAGTTWGEGLRKKMRGK